MITNRFAARLGALLILSGAVSLRPTVVRAHCDGLDGPVVHAARAALDKGEVNLVLVWVQKADEPQIRGAFERTLAVRSLSPEAKELADSYFFETLVRVHRTGEGAPYTGLKPAGRDLGPAIPAADKALETGNVEALTKLLTSAVQVELGERFHQALAAKDYQKDDVAAGRKYVANYVAFVHYVERAYEAVAHPAPGHDAEEAAGHHEEGR
jgi:hypothetical protein